MTQPFYERLKAYYTKVGEVLRGEADAASIFPNPTDVGTGREQVYARFLQSHLPSSCNVLQGGFLFGLDGTESKQIDLIVTSDVAPQFKLSPDGKSTKSFACVDGSLAVMSIKSRLDSAQLPDALDNIASIPDKREIDEKMMPLVRIPRYNDWPLKVIYASTGIAGNTLQESLNRYYTERPDVPLHKRPHIIHVAGGYVIVRVGPEGAKTRGNDVVMPESFHLIPDATDAYGLAYTIHQIQKTTVAARLILFEYGDILDGMPF